MPYVGVLAEPDYDVDFSQDEQDYDAITGQAHRFTRSRHNPANPANPAAPAAAAPTFAGSGPAAPAFLAQNPRVQNLSVQNLTAPDLSGPSATAPDAAAAEPGLTIAELQARIRGMQGTRLDTRELPTHPAIATLLPGGGLQQGGVYCVDQSATLLMALLAGPSAAGSWCGIIGVPEFGVEAASQYGIDLDRLVLVPHPGDQWLPVTAAIADVLTVVVIRPPRQVGNATVARLAARLRQKGSTLIVMGSWPQTDAMLSLSQSVWQGIGDGHGHLAAREVTLTVSTRAGGIPQSARMWLPDRDQKFVAQTSSDRTSSDQNGSRPGGARLTGVHPTSARQSGARQNRSGWSTGAVPQEHRRELAG